MKQPLSTTLAFIKRSRLWLCGLGVIVAMSVLAAMPPVSNNSAAGINQPGRAKYISSSQKTDESIIQTASGAPQNGSPAGQGSYSVIQGTIQPPSSASLTSNPSPVVPADLPLPYPQDPVCAYHAKYPLGVCGRLLCPDYASASCSRCGPLPYACLLD